ncbi:MAG: DNA methyltransferase [Sulfitobacter sp.]
MHRTIAAKRNRLGLRLSDAAVISGLAIPTIRKLEAGQGSLRSLCEYVHMLDLKLDWFGLEDGFHGSSIADRRKQLRISQRTMAQRICVSHRTIIALETKFRGRVDTLMKVMQVLRLKPTVRSLSEPNDNNAMALVADAALPSVLDDTASTNQRYALIEADAQNALRQMPASIADCIMTSLPYWQQRSYAAGGIGEEQTVEAYLTDLRAVFRQAHRVLKPRGSLWINIDDSYHQKSLQGIPWRLVLGMIEDSGWLVRNDVIWSKSGGGLNRSNNRMTHRPEHLFHLVKQENYHFDADAIRQEPVLARLDQHEIATATGLTQAACIKRIEATDALSETEKQAATDAVSTIFQDIANGQLHDFRLVLRGSRVTHSDSPKASARAGRLDDHGFYILKYDPRGSLPSDVWDLAPDRSTGRENHYAAYPTSLCEKPILATCPAEGLVIDPFVGTGTTLVAALQMERRGIGIDLSQEYLSIASRRLSRLG